MGAPGALGSHNLQLKGGKLKTSHTITWGTMTTPYTQF